MKKITKKAFYFFSLFCILALNSCEKDLYEEKKPVQVGIVTHEQFQTLMQQPQFLKAISKVPKKVKTTFKVVQMVKL